MKWAISRRAQQLTSSAIREILKVTERPEVISFAGGLPSPASFPVAAMEAATARVFADNPQAALQYAATEGYLPLREFVARRHDAPVERVLITTGSQQALDLIAKVMIDPGSKVLVETPSYLGALQAFSLFEPEFVSIPSDDKGLLPEALTPELTAGARFLYALPNFQNPTGRRLPLERREALVARAKEQGVLLVEDDPYGALSYTGDQLPSLLSMNPDGVIYMGSFSKILAPGMRLGYVIAPPELHFKLCQAKQASDLHTPTFTQRVAYETIRDGLLDTHIPTIRELYGKQCQYMLDALKRHMPEGVTWNEPEGGMFIWMELPEGLDSMVILEEAVKRNVAYVPGAPFYASNPKRNALRLAFVTVSAERIEQGVAILGELFREAIAAAAARQPRAA
ncbi:DNA-binding transcriptional regulator, MocR family, contains an aminotransferase domain [Cupriavidus necator]|uniref:PLP-dependent aminotransferase family protein n=1 Tax=Cupriavidus necator (strain ATCC 17699 / DSM 428 / KCTC 22496 / NCIMB 10442 / H16 / Stanier 337) TaxID=381666 RepID=Q0K8C9_CUPNH|nr:PLP-dependent aminotransferase family protein [Cupriavidus necator]KUE90403.1 2-aminoadipate aminotransferase [Cupriavidus necator]QCC01521.1 PLP-dependent aminotransferase family protein [Cupriavidus necator H16]QQB75647.1 PLP-dependent aminotransferase family protein [Cupriavidus necator]WKA39913.1 PLP-dependent aminotransferase family protein [Cupriavidus necator]CAJ93742.1 transcriptional regulator, MocR family [Cupriavidus necator H16]